MKKKIVGILVCTLLITTTFIAVATPMNIEKSSSDATKSSRNIGCCMLIAERWGHRVIEIDSTGTIVWNTQLLGLQLNQPVDVERLTNGNTLITEAGGTSGSVTNRVREIDNTGTIIWSITNLNLPTDAERLANGNTLITEYGGAGRVIEVDNAGTIVWDTIILGLNLGLPMDSERLANGNTVITELGAASERVIEIDSSGTILWNTASLGLVMEAPDDAERLANGNTLISEFGVGIDPERVIEVDSSGTIVWDTASLGLILDLPRDIERLANGNTLIAEGGSNRVIEVDSTGTILWDTSLLGLALNDPWDVERLPNQPPTAPTITGPNSGKPGTSYTYTFTSTDPDVDQVSYYIKWGDGGVTTWTPFQVSGPPGYSENHIWGTTGTYIIEAKAKDICGEESSWSTFQVIITRGKFIIMPFLQSHPNMFPLLQRLFQRLGLQ